MRRPGCDEEADARFIEVSMGVDMEILSPPDLVSHW